MSFVPFPSIGQFRETLRHINDVVRYKGRDENGEPIFDSNAVLPKLKLTGTVKVHGTNAAITRELDGSLTAQSRQKSLIFPLDNAGFRAFKDKIEKNEMAWGLIFQDIERLAKDQGIDHTGQLVTLFGEWAGRGIQTNVSVSEVTPFFYMFAAKVGESWIDIANLIDFPSLRIFNGESFGKYEIEVDFNDKTSVAEAQNKMIELTLAVEEKCPVGAAIKALDNAPDTIQIGEGVVYTCKDPAWSGVLFKVKGEKHSHSKVRVLASVDVDKVSSAQAFVEYAVTENRMMRGVDFLKESGKEISKKSTGDFVSWLCRDAIKEEMDTIQANGLDTKMIGNMAGTKGRAWFFEYLDKQVL